MFEPLWWGWPIDPGARRYRRGKHGPRKMSLMWATTGGYWTYVAVSPCGVYAKIGRSWNPMSRLYVRTGIREVERRLGIGRIYLVRAYGGDRELERRCHAFLAPDRVEETNEWYRVGPRVRILIARLDREFGPFDLRDDFRASLDHQQVSEAA